MQMFGIGKTPNPNTAQYAKSADFCRIFHKDMNRLYRLSLLLTGNQVAAEKCFVQGLSDSKESNQVFKEWAEAWALRTIVQNAIQVIHPRPADSMSSENVSDCDVTEPAEIAAILELPAFDRFAYVLSVLEGYPLQECALLLNCTRGEVNSARMRALQEIVKSIERRDGTQNVRARNRALLESGRMAGPSQWAATL
jgi:DNA-directed RNA polymerase specialized sigma24 family protein